MRRTGQAGGATLAMVMLLLIVGLLLVGALRQQLDDAVRQGNDERRYLQAFNQALSSLSWGASLRWPRAGGWQCRQSAADGLTACLLSGERDEAALLRGEGRLPGAAHALKLYLRVRIDESADADAAAGGTADGALRPLAQGWLDFCPLKEESRCDDDQ